MEIKYKIAYTPFITKQVSDVVIPESAFLHPIQLSEEVISELEGELDRNKTIKKDKDRVINQKSETRPEYLISNLQWARSKNKNSNRQPMSKTDPSIDQNIIKQNQMMAESSGNTKAVSHAGAKGLYQIMDSTHKDYVAATGHHGDLFDPEYNTKVRDWYMDWLGKHKIINTQGVSDFTKTARQLVAYNWGIGNLQKLLNKHRANGVDVDNSLDWLEGLPTETRNYVEKILLKNYPMNNQTT